MRQLDKRKSDRAMGDPEGIPCSVRIAVCPQLLARLIDSKQIAVADIRCLDAQAKQMIWRYCLKASLRCEQ